MLKKGTINEILIILSLIILVSLSLFTVEGDGITGATVQDSQAASDAESARQQAESDAESASQQAASDAESARQQYESDVESLRQQAESDSEEEEAVTSYKTEADGVTEEKTSFIDENGNLVSLITKTEIKDGETIIEVEEKTISPDGFKTYIKTKTAIKDGEETTEIEKKYTEVSGKEVIIKSKTEMEEGEHEVTNLIEVTGAQVATKLEIKAESEEDGTMLKALLSTGAEQAINVFPDQALQIALDELNTVHDLVIEIKEVTDEDELKAVFSATATKKGKLFGIFDTQVDLKTLINTETGEVIQTTKPWWAVLVVGENEETICHISSKTGVTTTILITEVKEHLAHGDSLGACPIVCGDGLLVESEACDDGNVMEGDGCDGLCQIEVPENDAIISIDRVF